MSLTEHIEEKFSPIARSVEQFAGDNGFQIGKCLRGNAGWELSREHPNGGVLHLLLLYDEKNGLGIGSTWQVDCPEMGMIYSHFRTFEACEIESNTVLEQLRKESEELSRVKFGYWTHLQPRTDANHSKA